MERWSLTVRVKNFKGISEIEEIDLDGKRLGDAFSTDADITVLIGANNSGKTSLLEAIWVADDPFDQTLSNYGRLVDVAALHSTSAPALQRLIRGSKEDKAEISLESEGWGRHITIAYHSLPVNYLEVRSKDDSSDVVVGIASLIRAPPQAAQPLMQQLLPMEAGALGELSKRGVSASASVRVTSLPNAIVRELWFENLLGQKLGAAYISLSRLRELETVIVGRWSQVPPDSLKRVADDATEMLKLTGETDRKIVNIVAEPNEVGDAEIKLLDDKGLRTPLHLLGDGLQHAIVAELVASYTSSSRLLLLDDVEVGLNPSSLERFMNSIVDLVVKGEGQRKVIMATHSIDVLAVLASLSSVKVEVAVTRLEGGVLKYTKLSASELPEMPVDVRHYSPGELGKLLASGGF